MKPNTENGDDSEEADSRRTQAPKPNSKSRRNRSRVRRRPPPTHQTPIRLKTRASPKCGHTYEKLISRRSYALKEIEDVVVSEEALRREVGWLGRSGDYHLPKKRNVEDFIERPLPLVCEIRRKGLYTSSQKILLVGEGDFSFSACLADAFGSATNMVATSLDSWEFLCKHYEGAMWNILNLTGRSCAVVHGIDATMIAWKYSPLQEMQFDRIIFNFPHVGVFKYDAPREASLRDHRKLIRMFLANAKMMIKMDGEIHIRHKSNGFFRDWNIQQLGENEGLQLIETMPFHPYEYEGYNTKFGFGGKANRNFDCHPSNTYRFGLPFKSRQASAASIYYLPMGTSMTIHPKPTDLGCLLYHD
ncbi:hypothetical protein Dimus_027297 [Dionaea muscipula]